MLTLPRILQTGKINQKNFFEIRKGFHPASYKTSSVNQAITILEEFDLLQCIDKALGTFGSSVKNAVFWRMTILHNSSRSEVISDPRALVEVIKETFGSGASAIETSIIQEIRKKFQLSSKGTGNLADAITEAKGQIIISFGPGQNQKPVEMKPEARVK